MADAPATTILMVGNPGCGKSTLLNGLLGEVRFRSGTSPGTGLTYQFDQHVKDGVRFFDTPGLDDKKKREAAAKAITEALKQEGHYKVFFVITLEQGRVKPADVATLQIVLDAAPITDYGIVINQVQPGIMKKVRGSAPASSADADTVSFEGQVKATLFAELKLPTELIVWVPLDNKLNAEDDVEWNMPQDLQDEFRSLKGMTITASSVADIDPATFEQKVQEKEALIDKLHADQAAMSRAMQQLEAAKAAKEAEFRQEAERLRQEKLEAQRKQREQAEEAQRQVDEAWRAQQKQVAAAENARREQQRRDEARLREVRQDAARRERELLSGPGWQQVQEAEKMAKAAKAAAKAAEESARAARLKQWEEKGWYWRLARLQQLRQKQGLTPAESQERNDLASFESTDRVEEEARKKADSAERARRERERNNSLGGGGLGALLGGMVAGPVGAFLGGAIGGAAGYGTS